MLSVPTDNRLAHILVCTNQRSDSSLPCCADAQGERVYQILDDWLAKHQLRAAIWLTKTHCLGWCHGRGTTVAIYPQDIFYRAVTPEDCAHIIEHHLRPLLHRP